MNNRKIPFVVSLIVKHPDTWGEFLLHVAVEAAIITDKLMLCKEYRHKAGGTHTIHVFVYCSIVDRVAAFILSPDPCLLYSHNKPSTDPRINRFPPS